MSTSRWTTNALVAISLLLPAIAAAEALTLAPVLPERIATHFGLRGEADGWMSQRGAFWLMATVWLVVVLPLSFLPALVRSVPDTAINLPHRDHWLAPERRDETRAYLAGWCAAFAAATSALLAWTQHLLLAANLTEGHPRLDPSFGLGLAAYLGGTLWGAVVLVRHFRRPGRGEPRSELSAE